MTVLLSRRVDAVAERHELQVSAESPRGTTLTCNACTYTVFRRGPAEQVLVEGDRSVKHPHAGTLRVRRASKSIGPFNLGP